MVSLFFLFLLVGCLAGQAWGQLTTGWLSPTQDFGQFRNPTRAYADDVYYASADPGLVHVYYGYAFFIPQRAEILGIEVRVDAWRHPAGTPFVAYFDVQLSWDGGVSWTAPYTAGPLESYELPFILGGPNDGWGRAWQPHELQPHTFLVRLGARAPRWPELRLDWVAVRVHYRTGLSLDVHPTTLDLGVLCLADYDRGYVERLSAQTLRITSASSWTLSVASLASAWHYTGTLPNPRKPGEHLLWRVESVEGPVTTATKTFTPMSTAERLVAAGSAGLVQLTLSFRLLVDYDTTWPGTYTLDLRYTLTSP